MFNRRSQQHEKLDETKLDRADLYQNLKEFSIINEWLGCKRTLIDSLDKIVSKYKEDCLQRNITIADLGCGGGDLLIAMHQWAKNKKIEVDLIGFDHHQMIVEFAKNTTAECQNINILCMDVFSEEFRKKQFDIVVLNNICHHFTDDQIINLIRSLKNQTRLSIVINDLQRNRLAYFLIKLISKLFKFSSLGRNDGPLSVRKAFKLEDLKKYLAQSTTSSYEIRKTWAFRWQVIIERKEFFK